MQVTHNEFDKPIKGQHISTNPEVVTGKYETIYYGTKPTVTEKDVIITTIPTYTSYKPVQDSGRKKYSYKPSSSPGSIKSMAFIPIKSEKPTVPAKTMTENEHIQTSKTPSLATNKPMDKFTQAMKKYTYAVRTTASPSYLIRNQLPETPTSYYQYSDSRTGLPQVNGN